MNRKLECRKKIVHFAFIFLLWYSIEVNASVISCEEFRENKADTFSAVLPTTGVGGGSPLDFIMDPYALIQATDAVRYGGRNFEKGATLYFENAVGEYDFSSNSDWFTVTNYGADVVCVTVNARIENLGNIVMTDDISFGEDMSTSIYLAIVDNKGNEVPFDAEGEACVTVTVDASFSEIYEFGLKGSCNPKGNWKGVDVNPKLTLVWHIDTIDSEVEQEGEKNDGQSVLTVSGGDSRTVSSGDRR